MPPAKSDTLIIENTGTRRVILGPPPKSQRGKGKEFEDAKVVLLDTPMDDKVVTARWGRQHELEGPTAKQWRDSKILKAAAPKLGLQVA